MAEQDAQGAPIPRRLRAVVRGVQHRKTAPADRLADEALLAGLGADDPRAGAAFVRRFQGRAYGLALTILGDPTAADDVAQEAMARAWRHAQAYDPRRGSVATWLLSITRNLAIDNLRLRRAVPLDPESMATLQHPTSGDLPGDAAVAADDAERLKEALGQLPVEQQRALVLAAFHGRTAREIGEIENIPLGTAKTRIRAGLLKLRASMVEEGAPRWA